MPNTDVVDFRELIAQPIGNWEAPVFKLLPVRHYFGKVVDVDLGGQGKAKEDGREGTHCWVFYVSPTEPGPDFTPEDHKAIEGLDLSEFEFPTRRFYGVNPATLWIHPNSMHGNRVFFENMGFPTTKPMEECANEMKGRNVLMAIGLEPSPTRTDPATGQPVKYNVLVTLTGDPRSK